MVTTSAWDCFHGSRTLSFRSPQCCHGMYCWVSFSSKYRILQYSQLSQSGHHCKVDTSLWPTWLAGLDRIEFLLFFCNEPLYKADNSLRRTARACPDGVRHLRESSLYGPLTKWFKNTWMCRERIGCLIFRHSCERAVIITLYWTSSLFGPYWGIFRGLVYYSAQCI